MESENLTAFGNMLNLYSIKQSTKEEPNFQAKVLIGKPSGRQSQAQPRGRGQRWGSQEPSGQSPQQGDPGSRCAAAGLGWRSPVTDSQHGGYAGDTTCPPTPGVFLAIILY